MPRHTPLKTKMQVCNLLQDLSKNDWRGIRGQAELTDYINKTLGLELSRATIGNYARDLDLSVPRATGDGSPLSHYINATQTRFEAQQKDIKTLGNQVITLARALSHLSGQAGHGISPEVQALASLPIQSQTQTQTPTT